MNSVVIVAISIAYLLLLFLIASWAEKRTTIKRSLVANPYVYALSLAIFCTAWTFYGSVGRTITNGIEFLTVYIGPTMLMPLWWVVFRKLIRISKVQRITNLADFVSARYGRSRALGVLVTLLCVVGLVPYISIQIKAIGSSIDILTAQEVAQTSAFWQDNVLYLVVFLGVFTMLFGTRRLEAHERHEGLVAAIAFESLFKLVAFLAVGLFVTFGVFDGFDDIAQRAAQHPPLQSLFVMDTNETSSWFWHCLVSGLAIMFLPRQFQVAIVENTRENHLRKAIWLFPLYLLAINLFVIPIAFGGYLTFGDSVKADHYVLALPIYFKQEGLALLTYLGGFSAATSMIIVECTALTIMVSNNLVLPLLVGSPKWLNKFGGDMGQWIINMRRVSVALLLLLAYFYYKFVSDRYSLVSVGMVSFAAVAQLAPAVFGGLFWKQGAAKGTFWGLIAGWAVWFYTLIVPSMANAGFLPVQWLESGPWGIAWLHPEHLFGLTYLDNVSHGIFWSLLVNIGCYVGGSLLANRSAQEQNQATLFVDVFAYSEVYESSVVWKGKALVTDLQSLLGNFLGTTRAERLLNLYAKRNNINLKNRYADPRIVNYAEKILSGAIGTASARLVVASVAKEEKITVEEVIDILKTSRELQLFNEELRKKSEALEKLTDQLQTANEQLQRMDQQKDDFLSTVTHEIRTPLTSIRMLSEIVQDNPDLEEEQRDHFLGTIIKESDRLMRLVNEVLDLERFDSGRIAFHEDVFEITEAISSALDSVLHLAKEKNVQIQNHFEGDLTPIKADRDRLVQVYINLVSNAIKYCYPDMGVIKIKTTQDSEFLTTTVTDNGAGIEAEFLPLIFDKFYQAKKRSSQKPTGSGLGLAITKKIIELYEGEISAQSSPNLYTTFTFKIPMKSLSTAAQIDQQI
ncbi:MAG: ATP-binding protein [Spirosomaceae bacterium]|nr:ATP-binding protein [Spirosomataceae bacterium]